MREREPGGDHLLHVYKRVIEQKNRQFETAAARSDQRELVHHNGRGIHRHEIVNGGSILELIRHLRDHKARSIRIACTHGIFSSSAAERLAVEADILEIVCTNTVAISAEKRVPKLTVLSIAPALAEAMRRINNGESVSALFHPEANT